MPTALMCVYLSVFYFFFVCVDVAVAVMHARVIEKSTGSWVRSAVTIPCPECVCVPAAICVYACNKPNERYRVQFCTALCGGQILIGNRKLQLQFLAKHAQQNGLTVSSHSFFLSWRKYIAPYDVADAVRCVVFECFVRTSVCAHNFILICHLILSLLLLFVQCLFRIDIVVIKHKHKHSFA